MFPDPIHFSRAIMLCLKKIVLVYVIYNAPLRIVHFSCMWQCSYILLNSESLHVCHRWVSSTVMLHHYDVLLISHRTSCACGSVVYSVGRIVVDGTA